MLERRRILRQRPQGGRFAGEHRQLRRQLEIGPDGILVEPSSASATGFDFHARSDASARDALAGARRVPQVARILGGQGGRRDHLRGGGRGKQFGRSRPGRRLAHEFAGIALQFGFRTVEPHDVFQPGPHQDVVDLGVRHQDAHPAAAFQHAPVQGDKGVDGVRVQVFHAAKIDDDAPGTPLDESEGFLAEAACVEDFIGHQLDGEDFEDPDSASLEPHKHSVLCARRGSNPQPSPSEGDALSNCATSAGERQT